MILLQTVLEETRKRSTNNYKKLKEIMANRKDDFYVFVNEHHKYGQEHLLLKFQKQCSLFCYIVVRDTYVERRPGESANDRNDRAIRKACSWYQAHMEESQNSRGPNKKVKVILLTQDFKNREQALADGLKSYKGKFFVHLILTFC